MAATQHGECDRHARIELELTASEALQLVFAQAFFVGDGAIKLHPKGYTRVEVVQKRHAAGVDVAANGLNAEDTGAGVAGKDKSEVGGETGLVRKRLLAR